MARRRRRPSWPHGRAREVRPKAKPPARTQAKSKPAARRRLSPAEKARIQAIFEHFARSRPDPHTELEYKNPFTLLVAVVLSAQATDKSVNKATERLFAVADTPQKMLALGEAGLTPMIASIGLFRTKAKNVDRPLAHPGRAVRRPGPAGARGAAGPARRRPQDRQRGAERAGRRAGHRRRHPRLPRRPPAEAVATARPPTRSKRDLMAIVPERLSDPGPPLADPARPLHLPGAQAQVRRLPRSAPLPVARAVSLGAGGGGRPARCLGPALAYTPRACRNRISPPMTTLYDVAAIGTAATGQ